MTHTAREQEMWSSRHTLGSHPRLAVVWLVVVGMFLASMGTGVAGTRNLTLGAPFRDRLIDLPCDGDFQGLLISTETDGRLHHGEEIYFSTKAVDGAMFIFLEFRHDCVGADWGEVGTVLDIATAAERGPWGEKAEKTAVMIRTDEEGGVTVGTGEYMDVLTPQPDGWHKVVWKIDTEPGDAVRFLARSLGKGYWAFRVKPVPGAE